MKLLHYVVDEGERDALISKFRVAMKEHNVTADVSFGSELIAFDSDFIPTTNVNDARWLYADSYTSCILIRINNDGSMTHLKVSNPER